MSSNSQAEAREHALNELDVGRASARSYSRTSVGGWIWSHILRYKLYTLIFVCGAVLLGLLSSLIPRLTGTAFDAIAGTPPDWPRFVGICTTILAAVLLRLVIDFAKGFAVEVLGKRMERDARDELYISLLGKSQTFHNRQQVGDLLARTANDVQLFNAMMNSGIDIILTSLMHLIVPIVLIGALRAELLIAPLLFVVAFIISLVGYIQRIAPVAEELRERFSRMGAGLAESIDGIEVVKVMGQEEQERLKFAALARAYHAAAVQNGRLQARYLPPLLLALAITGALIHGAVLVAGQTLSLGDLVAYLGLMAVLRFPADLSIFTLALVQMGVVSAGRILAVLRDEAEQEQPANGHSALMQGHISFEHVTYVQDGVTILKDVSFEAGPDQTVAIVGQTGSGKTTLTQLINRTYDVSAGRITIDGVDVRSWDLGALRRQIATIEQDVFLFSRSIADNIAFGLGAQVDRSAVEQAAREAQAHEFTTAFSEGYETVIGERGVTLSGGQRQRLAIARALLIAPRVLILDDSTSAVDSATEDAIQRAIRRVLQGRTTLLITHRLAQIRWADQILVLKQGVVLDQGSHAELMARCDLYRQLFARHDQPQAGAPLQVDRSRQGGVRAEVGDGLYP